MVPRVLAGDELWAYGSLSQSPTQLPSAVAAKPSSCTWGSPRQKVKSRSLPGFWWTVPTISCDEKEAVGEAEGPLCWWAWGFQTKPWGSQLQVRGWWAENCYFFSPCFKTPWFSEQFLACRLSFTAADIFKLSILKISAASPRRKLPPDSRKAGALSRCAWLVSQQKSLSLQTGSWQYRGLLLEIDAFMNFNILLVVMIWQNHEKGDIWVHSWQMIYVPECHEEERVSNEEADVWVQLGVLGVPATWPRAAPSPPRSRGPFGAPVRQRHRLQVGSGWGGFVRTAPPALFTPQPSLKWLWADTGRAAKVNVFSSNVIV